MSQDCPNPAIRDWSKAELKCIKNEDELYYNLNAHTNTKKVYTFAYAQFSCGFTLSSKIAVKTIDTPKKNFVQNSNIFFSTLNENDCFISLIDNLTGDCFLENDNCVTSQKPFQYGIKGIYSPYG
jgi:hypothetical protein